MWKLATFLYNKYFQFWIPNLDIKRWKQNWDQFLYKTILFCERTMSIRPILNTRSLEKVQVWTQNRLMVLQ